MKILIITQNTPYPLSDGGKIAQYTIIDYLRHKCAITLLLFADSDPEHQAINKLKCIWPNVNIEVISTYIAEPIIEKKFNKLILHFILKNLEHIKFRINKVLNPNSSHRTVENEDIDRLQYLVSFAQYRDSITIDKLVSLVESTKPDLVQMEFVDTADLSLCLSKETKKIFVQHEIRFRRVETEIRTVKDKIGNYGHYAQNLSELLEINLLNTFEGIVTFSEDDKQRLLQKLSVRNIISSPFAILNEEIKKIDEKDFIFDKLVFVGFENHSPNRDAVEWYISSMATKIYERFGFVLHVIGNWSPEFKLRHSHNKAIFFAGFVDDLSGYCKNSIMVVPLRVGSGIRTKILHSMAWGLPIISTNIGSEGIIDNEKILFHANNSEEFIEAIETITGDVHEVRRKIISAQAVLKKHYSQDAAGEKRFLFYQSVVENRL